MKPTNDNIITVSGVSKQFVMATDTVQAVKQASCVIPRNSFTIVYGASGSGKSTLFHVIAGLERPTSGQVSYEDVDMYTLSNDQRANFRARAIGVIYQSNYWVNSLSVIENVSMPLLVSGYSLHQAKLFAKESLALVDMLDYASRNPTALSGGQQQRVSLARALVANPMVIMADEPTGNLDSLNGQMVVDILLSFQKKYGKTIIMITHNLAYLVHSTHRLYMQDGMLTEESGKWSPKSSIESAQRKLDEVAIKSANLKGA